MVRYGVILRWSMQSVTSVLRVEKRHWVSFISLCCISVGEPVLRKDLHAVMFDDKW